MNFDSCIEKNRNQLIRTTQELVRIKSVEDDSVAGGPFGQGVKDCLERTLEICRELGFKTKNIDGYAGHAEMGSGKDLIGVLVHLDVVPEGNGWIHEPYSGKIIDGKIFGRGSTDNKGPAVSVIYALHLLKKMKIAFKKRIRIIFGCNEESGWRGIKYYFQKEEKPCCGFTPDGLFPIINREKGILQVELSKKFAENDDDFIPIKIMRLKGGLRPNIVPDLCQCEIFAEDGQTEKLKNILLPLQDDKDIDITFNRQDCRIRTRGLSVASSIPEKGKNAIIRLFGILGKMSFSQSAQYQFIQFILKHIGQEVNGKMLGIQMEDLKSGPLTLNLGVADINSKKGKITLDIRYPVNREEEEIIERIRQKVAGTGISVEKKDGKAPLYVSEDHFMIKKLSRVYEEVTGEKANLLSIGGGTYARALENIVAFGSLFPGREILAHQVNEYLCIEDLIKMTKIYTPAIQALVEG